MDAIVVAAGSGSRIGTLLPKQYLLLKEKPILYYSLHMLEKSDLIERIYVVISRQAESIYFDLQNRYFPDFKKLQPHLFGGEQRQDSVFVALQKIKEWGETDFVAIHDSARPFLTESLLLELKRQAENYGGAAPGLPMNDTVKTVDEEGIIQDHPIRDRLRAIQTPQLFRFSQLYEANLRCREVGLSVTDDTEIFSRFSDGKVKIVEGSRDLFKITYPEDLEKAAELVEKYE